MHFSKTLEQELVAEWRAHYLQYKLLKKHIKHLVSECADRRNDALALFKPVLDRELAKINSFAQAKAVELQNRLVALLQHATLITNTKASSPAQVSAAAADADATAQELVALDKFVRQNFTAARKIVKKFDKRLQFNVAPWIHAQLVNNEPFMRLNLDALLVALSDVYELINNLRSSAYKATNTGISAQSFERKTTKYWVREKDLMALKVTIIKNLPVYLFDRKSNKKTENTLALRLQMSDFQATYGNLPDGHPITSIYLDNDAMDVYKRRINREEGAQLTRIRWYGNADDLSTASCVFMERKTHHESWVNAKSVKERFPLHPSKVSDYMTGKFDPTTTMADWMKPDPYGVVLIKSEKELENASTLASEIQSSILGSNLKPMVRTVYRRSAFQARDHNEVRISIDSQLAMINENISMKPSSWYRDVSNVPHYDVLQFPFCILEVKLNCDTPPTWISDLLADEGMVMECHKFSKFLTGCGYLSPNVPELPYWFAGHAYLDPRNRFATEEKKEELVRLFLESGTAPESETMEREQSENEEFKTKSKKNEPGNGKEMRLEIDYGKEDVTEVTPLLPNEESHGSQQTKASVKPSFYFGRVLSILKRGPPPTSTSNLGAKPIRQPARVKIEPKTLFASERTFLQWISASSLMLTLATLILAMNTPFSKRISIVFFTLSILTLVYATARYHFRARAIRNRKVNGYEDLVGPTVLAGAVMVAVGVILYMTFANTTIGLVLPETGGGCGQVSMDGISNYANIKDVVAISDGSVWVVAPFMMAAYTGGMWNTMMFPGYAFESVTSYKQDNLLVTVSAPQKEMLLYNMKTSELSSVANASLLEMLNTYKLSLNAIAFHRPSGERCNEDGIIFITDIDANLYKMHIYRPSVMNCGGPVNEMALEMIDMVPWHMFARDFNSTMRSVSSLSYDANANRISILFQHARNIRTFDLTTGDIVASSYTPGTTTGWSGISIIDDVLFMSMNGPAGIWTFNNAVTTGFESCARVYDGEVPALTA